MLCCAALCCTTIKLQAAKMCLHHQGFPLVCCLWAPANRVSLEISVNSPPLSPKISTIGVQFLKPRINEHTIHGQRKLAGTSPGTTSKPQKGKVITVGASWPNFDHEHFEQIRRNFRIEIIWKSLVILAIYFQYSFWEFNYNNCSFFGYRCGREVASSGVNFFFLPVLSAPIIQSKILSPTHNHPTTTTSSTHYDSLCKPQNQTTG